MLYVNAIADTVIEARQGRAADRGIDLGAMEQPPVEPALVVESPLAVEAEVSPEAFTPAAEA